MQYAVCREMRRLRILSVALKRVLKHSFWVQQCSFLFSEHLAADFSEYLSENE